MAHPPALRDTQTIFQNTAWKIFVIFSIQYLQKLAVASLAPSHEATKMLLPIVLNAMMVVQVRWCPLDGVTSFVRTKNRNTDNDTFYY